MQVSAQYAADHLDALLRAAQNSEDVQIANPDQASFRLTLVAPAPRQTSAKRILGAGVGEMIVPTDEEWRKMKEETASLMNDGPLFPSSEESAQAANGSDWRFPERPRSELFGCHKGKLILSQDWDSPETNQESPTSSKTPASSLIHPRSEATSAEWRTHERNLCTCPQMTPARPPHDHHQPPHAR